MGDPDKVLLPTSYFPPISYLATVTKYREIFIEQMETYPKQTYRNRCEIMTSSGKLNLIVPVTKPFGNHTLTKDITICYREPWQEHHRKSIQTAYRSTPYFTYYSDLIMPLFLLREESLVVLNEKILEVLLKIIGLNSLMQFTQDFIKKPENLPDLRQEFKPGKKSSGQKLQEYPQVFSHKHGFTSDLSILDLIFNLGPDSRGYLAASHKLQAASHKPIANS